MAKPTDSQIRKFETEHKMQFVDLVLANRFYLKLLPRLIGKSKTSREYQIITNYGKTVANLAGKWYKRQYLLEQRAKVPPIPKDLFKYFFLPKDEKKLIEG